MTSTRTAPDPVYFLCTHCGSASIVDRSNLMTWVTSEKRCPHCGTQDMVRISEKVYRMLYSAQVDAIPATTRAQIEASSQRIDTGLKI
jgi:hypothetical protein